MGCSLFDLLFVNITPSLLLSTQQKISLVSTLHSWQMYEEYYIKKIGGVLQTDIFPKRNNTNKTNKNNTKTFRLRTSCNKQTGEVNTKERTAREFTSAPEHHQANKHSILILILLESCQQTYMTYTVAECTVNKLLMMDRRTVRNM